MGPRKVTLARKEFAIKVRRAEGLLPARFFNTEMPMGRSARKSEAWKRKEKGRGARKREESVCKEPAVENEKRGDGEY